MGSAGTRLTLRCGTGALFSIGRSRAGVAALTSYRDGRRHRVSPTVQNGSAHDPQLVRLADAIAQKVGPQRFKVWFNPNSTKLDLRHDALEIAVQNDFISDWIGKHFTRPIQEAAHEVLGCSLPVRFAVVPQLFEEGDGIGGTTVITPIAPPSKGMGAKNGAKSKIVPLNGSGKHSNNNAQNGVAVTAVAAAQLITPAFGNGSIISTAPRGDRDSSMTVFANRPRL